MPIEWIAAAIGAATSIAGGLYGANRQSAESEEARDWSAQQYGQRYQVTMADMKAAGLNPILAYSQGPGQAPSAVPANMSGLSDAGIQAGGHVAQAQLRDAAAQQSVSTAKQQDQLAKKTAEEAELARMRKEDYEKVGPSADLATARRIGKGVDDVYKSSKVSVSKVREVKPSTPEWMMGDDLPKEMDPRLRSAIINDRFRVMKRFDAGRSTRSKIKGELGRRIRRQHGE